MTSPPLPRRKDWIFSISSPAVGASSTISLEEWLQSMPTLAVLSVQESWEDTPPIHKDSQGLPWHPTCHIPILISWAKHTHTHIPTSELHNPQSSLHSQASSERSPRASNSEILENKVFYSLPSCGGLLLQGHPNGKGMLSFRMWGWILVIKF